MADTMYSGLPAAGAALATHEWGVNEGGASKKLTIQQLMDLIFKRVAGNTVAAGEYLTSLVLAANEPDITGVTLVTVMSVTGVGVGRYRYKVQLIYQTTATTTGIQVAINHTGTLTQFAVEKRFASTGGANATQTPTQIGATGTGNLYEAQGSRTKGAGIGAVTLGVDTINADLILTVEGFMVVSVTGTFQVQLAAELAALVCRAMQGSSLELVKLS